MLSPWKLTFQLCQDVHSSGKAGRAHNLESKCLTSTQLHRAVKDHVQQISKQGPL